VIYVDRAKAHLDTLEVWVECSAEMHQQGEAAMEALSQRVRHAMRETLFVSTIVNVVAPGVLERSGGKARRVVDRRELG
jgi:phenylacetate-coenzyme A ligase PaaK-like adenylate-forming protein